MAKRPKGCGASVRPELCGLLIEWDSLGDLRIDGMVILHHILRNDCVWVSTAFIKLGTFLEKAILTRLFRILASSRGMCSHGA